MDSNNITIMDFKLITLLVIMLSFSSFAQSTRELQPHVLIVQPIVVQSDEGTDPASMAIPEQLVDKAYEKAGVDFYFLEPIKYNNTKARDGLINLDQIVVEAQKAGLLRGQDDMVNMFFVNAVDGHEGPLGRGMMGGNLTFIALGDHNSMDSEELLSMQAFVIAHEVGHNLSLKHAVDDPNVPDTIPNIQGDGPFKDRIDPAYSLNPYQVDIILQSPLVHPRIEFLPKNVAAKAILDESFEPYFSQLQIREIAAFVNEKVPTSNLDSARVFAKQKFASAVTDFTESEKNCISFVLDEVIRTLQNNHIGLMANHPWRFIKIEDWLCGGFAHTRGTCIILSQRHIDHLSKGWSDTMTAQEETKLVKNFGALLVHEQMHSLQRTHKSKFTQLYTSYWDFVHAHIPPEESIQIVQVSNPDAPVAEWIIPDPNEKKVFYWARTLLKGNSEVPQMGIDFTDKAFTIEKQDNAYSIKKDSDGKPTVADLSSLSFYGNSYPVTRGLDHPNEISAYMFADYFKAIFSGDEPFKGASNDAAKNADLFMDWISKEMVE